jgi:hypothetical protein
MLIVVLYVDDLLIAGSSLTVVEAFKKAIAAEFEMKDMGEAKWILGMEIVRDLEKGTIELKQRAYFERVLERFGMSRCKPVDTPAEERLRRLPEGQGGPDKTYMSLVGALLYGAVMTRPDILYAVSSLGRHLQATGPDHWRAAKRVLKYLKGTMEVGIVYGGQGAKELELEVYSDADWGGDIDTRRSTTGYVCMLNGGAISFASKLQPTVALSSAEAEYMALAAATQEVLHLGPILESMGVKSSQAIKVYEDNQGCIALAENPVFQKRSKHIDIRYHFVRERVEMGDIKVEYVSTEEQLADMLTKPIKRQQVENLRKRAMGRTGRVANQMV